MKRWAGRRLGTGSGKFAPRWKGNTAKARSGNPGEKPRMESELAFPLGWVSRDRKRNVIDDWFNWFNWQINFSTYVVLSISYTLPYKNTLLTVFPFTFTILKYLAFPFNIYAFFKHYIYFGFWLTAFCVNILKIPTQSSPSWGTILARP